MFIVKDWLRGLSRRTWQGGQKNKDIFTALFGLFGLFGLFVFFFFSSDRS
jgi:hypothetical protein